MLAANSGVLANSSAAQKSMAMRLSSYFPSHIAHRTLATTSRRCAEETHPTSVTASMQQTEESTNQDRYTSGSRAPARRNAPLPPYKVWIQSQGKAFERPPPGRGPFWIGDSPFPLNPSFSPPAPLSHQVKETMKELHWKDPQRNSVHALSQRFKVSKERVVAILRLMALESEQEREVSVEKRSTRG